MSEEYTRDVEAAIASVAKNYAGYADKQARRGPAVIAAADARAREQAALVDSHEDCLRVLAEYLTVFQDGHVSAIYFDADSQMRNARHLLAAPAPVVGGPTSDGPTARLIGSDTLLLTIPSFEIQYKEAIDALLDQNQAELARRDNLIIDVRGNGGGADYSYYGLLPYLYTDPIVTVGVDILATGESADAWEFILTMIPAAEAEMIAETQAEIRRMREAPEGTFIAKNEDSTETFPDVRAHPVRVAVVTDGRCGSTTEQFLLAARQSRKVTLFGQTTAGVLDYANVRLFPLPSGTRFLSLATTRSRRLPEDPVDNIGISPAVLIAGLTRPGGEDDTAADFVLDWWERDKR